MIVESANGLSLINESGILGATIFIFKNSDTTNYEVQVSYKNGMVNISFNKKEEANNLIRELENKMIKTKKIDELQNFKDAIEYALKLKG